MASAMVWMPILEDGVFRFDASEAARAAAGLSLSFAEPWRREVVLLREGVDGDGPAVVPECEVVGDRGVQKVLIKVQYFIFGLQVLNF
jgi:alpha-glucosidase